MLCQSPPHTAAHGVWRYLGEGRFGVTLWDLFYDVNQGSAFDSFCICADLGD